MRSRYSWWPRWSPGSRSIIRHCNASLVISRNAESPGGPCNISATIRISWGLKAQRMYLLDVFRRKLDFPDLKRSVRQLADLHHAKVVLIEDKASETSLIQELRAAFCAITESIGRGVTFGGSR